MKKKILFPVMLCLALLLLLAGCGNGKKPAGTTDPNQGTAPVEDIQLVVEGQTDYIIVRPENASTALSETASQLWSAFRKAGIKTIELGDEYKYQTEASDKPAIIIGTTADEVSIRLKSELRYNDFLIHVEGKNLYIIGGSDAATKEAVEYFISNYIGSEELTSLNLKGNLDMRYRDTYSITQLSIAGTDISSFRIVYDADLYYSKELANNVKKLFIDQCGIELAVVPDTEAAIANEILVGVTNRAESAAVAALHTASPNTYYVATVENGKMLLVNGGFRSGNEALKRLQNKLKSVKSDTYDLTKSTLDLNVDISSTIDKKALARAEGTDLRVMHYNVLGFTNTTNNPKNKLNDQQRAELLADTVLVYGPDVLTLNEMNPQMEMAQHVKALLLPYYNFTDGEYLALYPDPEKPSSQLQERKYSFPIAYRKDAGLTEVKSAFNYLSEMLYFHGVSWTVFEAANGNRFLVVNAHLANNADTSQFVEDVMRISNEARKEFGDLPMILNGDWFFTETTISVHAYNYMIKQGFVDSSNVALVNESKGIGTFHELAEGQQGRAEEDLIFLSPDYFESLLHKIIFDEASVKTSDHYPVFADLRFKKSCKADEIGDWEEEPEFIVINPEGPGGVGEWPGSGKDDE